MRSENIYWQTSDRASATGVLAAFTLLGTIERRSLARPGPEQLPILLFKAYPPDGIVAILADEQRAIFRYRQS
ncbi:MAG TPA: hypothetical protein VIT23_16125, partial [Terrimicrobiaceae bacterium]